MGEYRRLDGYRTEIEHEENGGWRWAVGDWIIIGYDFEHLSQPEARGRTATRWGAKRQAKRWIARMRRHEALSKKSIVIDEPT